MCEPPGERAVRFTVNDLLAEARRGLRRLTPAEALAAQAAGALIVDTRPAGDIARDGAIPGAVNFPRTVLEWRVDPASGYQHPAVTGFDQPIIVVCHEGYSSSLAAATLQRLGFHRATDLIGGFKAWRAAGLPVEGAGSTPA
jgi:rhodanese-related sulfurtransferase